MSSPTELDLDDRPARLNRLQQLLNKTGIYSEFIQTQLVESQASASSTSAAPETTTSSEGQSKCGRKRTKVAGDACLSSHVPASLDLSLMRDGGQELRSYQLEGETSVSSLFLDSH